MQKLFTRLTVLALIMAGAVVTVSAQTTVPSVISTDQVWDISGSPYLLTQNTYIDTGTTVIVKPGVKIIAQSSGLQLLVDGEFQALGKKDSTILLEDFELKYQAKAKSYDTATGEGAYLNYCELIGSGVAKRNVEAYNVNALITNCVFRDAYYSVWAFSSGNSNRVVIDQCEFYGLGTGQGYAVYCSGTSSRMEITNSHFDGSGRIYLYGSMLVENNEFYNMTEVSLTGYNTGLKVNCNRFVNVISDVMIRLGNPIPAEFQNNWLDTVGLRNDPMLLLWNNSSSNAFANFTCSGNNFMHNSGNGAKVKVSGSNTNPANSDTIDMRGNYWGTTNTSHIDTMIWDYNDDIKMFALVDYSNYLSAPDTSCSKSGSTCNASFYVALDTTNTFTLFVINNSTGTTSNTNYYWSFGDGSGSTTKNPQHHYNSFGKYNLCLTLVDSAAGCYSTYCDSIGLDSNGNLLKKAGFQIMILDESDVTGIEVTSAIDRMNVYPNPANNRLMVSITSISDMDLNMEIINAVGQVVKNKEVSVYPGENITEFDVQDLKEGIYFLKVGSENTARTTRIMIQH